MKQHWFSTDDVEVKHLGPRRPSVSKLSTNTEHHVSMGMCRPQLYVHVQVVRHSVLQGMSARGVHRSHERRGNLHQMQPEKMSRQESRACSKRVFEWWWQRWKTREVSQSWQKRQKRGKEIWKVRKKRKEEEEEIVLQKLVYLIISFEFLVKIKILCFCLNFNTQ